MPSLGAVRYLGVSSFAGLLGGLTGHDTCPTSIDGHAHDFYLRGMRCYRKTSSAASAGFEGLQQT